jgi:hypothetical protein
MDANLTRYTVSLRDEGHRIAALMVPSDTGEYVKFADVMELLSKSHNKQSEQCPHYTECNLNRGEHCLSSKGWSITC